MQFMSMRTLDALASCKINPIVFQIKIPDVFSTCLAKRPDKNQYTFHKRYGFLTPISMHQKFKHLLLFKSVSVQWTSNNLESFLLTCKEGSSTYHISFKTSKTFIILCAQWRTIPSASKLIACCDIRTKDVWRVLLSYYMLFVDSKRTSIQTSVTSSKFCSLQDHPIVIPLIRKC